MTPGIENPLDITLERTLQLSAIMRMLEKLPLIHALEKLVRLPKVVVDAIRFTAPRLSRGRRDGESKSIRILLPHRFGDRRLAATRWRGQDDYSRGHSRFSNCSRNFSRSPFIAITVWVMRASFAFEPIVLTSRNSSCARNPSCFPTA